MSGKKGNEIDEKYQQDLKRLVEKINERDNLLDFVNSRPFTPAVRNEKLRLIAILTKKIDEFEESLASEYELIQKRIRLEEQLEKDYAELDAMADKILPELLAHLKKTNPEAHDKLVSDLKAIEEAEDDDNE